MYFLLERMTSLPVSVLVLGIGIVRSQSIGYWVLVAELGIVLTLQSAILDNFLYPQTLCHPNVCTLLTIA